MNINIREELINDYKIVEELIEKSFKTMKDSDGNEHRLVKNLRNGNAFIKELSIVAEANNEIIAHCLLTKAKIYNEGKEFETLVLAPVCVSPQFQGENIGTEIINATLKKAKNLGYSSVIVLGHSKYYPKFGFCPASNYDIKAPFEVPDEVFMALELNNGALSNVSGTVVFAPEFSE